MRPSRRAQLASVLTISSAILGLLGLVVGILGILASLGTIDAGWFSSWFSWPILGGLFILAVIVFLGARSLTRFESYILSKPTYRLTKATYTLRVTDVDHEYQQVAHLDVLALRDGLNRYTGRYSWTGSGGVTVESLTDDPVSTRQGKWKFRYYDVGFPRGLVAGESRPVKLRFTCGDPGNTFLPILSKLIEESIDDLVLRVEFEGSHRPRRFAQEKYEHLLDDATAESAPEMLFPVGDSHLEWRIPEPNLRWDYVLRWWW